MHADLNLQDSISEKKHWLYTLVKMMSSNEKMQQESQLYERIIELKRADIEIDEYNHKDAFRKSVLDISAA